mgnify:FL=1
MESGTSSAPPARRLFLALWPDEAVRERIAEHASQWLWSAGCVRYAPQDWHLTLHFIGAVPAERVSAIAAAVALPCPPFELVLDQPMIWPHGLAVLGVTTLPAPLQLLHERLGEALRVLNLKVDARHYRPHLTLARHADAALPPAAAAPLHWPVRAYALALSTGRAGQRYQLLGQYS